MLVVKNGTALDECKIVNLAGGVFHWKSVVKPNAICFRLVAEYLQSRFSCKGGQR